MYNLYSCGIMRCVRVTISDNEENSVSQDIPLLVVVFYVSIYRHLRVYMIISSLNLLHFFFITF